MLVVFFWTVACAVACRLILYIALYLIHERRQAFLKKKSMRKPENVSQKTRSKWTLVLMFLHNPELLNLSSHTARAPCCSSLLISRPLRTYAMQISAKNRDRRINEAKGRMIARTFLAISQTLHLGHIPLAFSLRLPSLQLPRPPPLFLSKYSKNCRLQATFPSFLGMSMLH